MNDTEATIDATADVGDIVVLIKVSGSLFLVTARTDGTVPLNSRILARLQDCPIEVGERIAAMINRGIAAERAVEARAER